MRRAVALMVAGLLGAVSLRAQTPPPSPVLQAMKAELARSLEALHSQPTPPYFLGYDITEVSRVTLSSSFGAITERTEDRRRALDIELRVGTYAFDNTHGAGSDFPAFLRFAVEGAVDVPLDDDPMAIRAALWSETEQRYRSAVEQLSRVRTNAGLRVAAADSSPDFSREALEHYMEPALPLVVDRPGWEQRIRRYTAPFAQHGDIYGANAVFTAAVETHWYVNSEGTEIQTSQPAYRLSIAAFSKADDGMELPRYESFFAATPEGLPDDPAVLKAVDRMIADLEALRRAPAIEPYTGPAILSGRASAVFFHEILGHRLEGHRQKNEDEGQTFTRRVTDAVLPADFSVYFDPTLQRLGGTDLAGYYRYDDEGVRARRVPVIERGVLKTFLMSRTPIEGFANSNGHGRRQVGFAPVARQSNLIVHVAAPRTRAQLKQMLIEQIRRQRKPFGLLFDDIEGGFTITQRGIPNAFEVLPIMVYRVFPDGREELVRGVDLIGTPLTVFSKVTAGDDHPEVFNGLCGAESGFVPVSAVSPAVLISQIEVQKKPKSTELAPILPPPPAAGGGVAGAEGDTGDVTLRALRDELARSMAELRLDTMPRPYFLAYRVDEIVHLDATATLGSLIASREGRSRRLSVELRVGDYAFDNSNFFGMPSGAAGFVGELGGDLGELPIDDDYRALRRQVWLATDMSYKNAVEELAQKRATLANRTRRDELPDFTREAAVTLRDDVPVPRLDRGAVETLVREASAAFREAPEIYQSGVAWAGGVVRSWYVNSEGSWFVRVSPWGSVRAQAATLTTDGTPLLDGVSAYAASPDGLPARDSVTRSVRELATRLTALRRAPSPDAYNGPVLFEGRAAAELFASLFAPQLIADRRPMSDNPMFDRLGAGGEGFLDQLGGRVLPRSFSVADNPTLRTYEGKVLGGFAVDDDGVRARETKLVEHGILRTLLATRVPVRGVPRSTGSRRGRGAVVSNLFVTSDSGLTDQQLRRRLLAVAAERGAPYAIIVRRLGSWAIGGRRDPASLLAALGAAGIGLPAADVVRLYPDGREEPLRNASLSGITPASFKEVVAASRSRAVVTLPSRGPIPGRFFRALYTNAATYVVPSLVFEDVALRGPTGDRIRPPVIPPPWVSQR